MRLQRKQKVIEVTIMPYDNGDLKAGDGLITEIDGQVPTPEQRHIPKDELEADWEPAKPKRRPRKARSLTISDAHKGQRMEEKDGGKKK